MIAACLKEESLTQLREMEDENLIPVQMDVSSVNSIQQAYKTIINTHPQVQHGKFVSVSYVIALGLITNFNSKSTNCCFSVCVTLCSHWLDDVCRCVVSRLPPNGQLVKKRS